MVLLIKRELVLFLAAEFKWKVLYNCSLINFQQICFFWEELGFSSKLSTDQNSLQWKGLNVDFLHDILTILMKEFQPEGS